MAMPTIRIGDDIQPGTPLRRMVDQASRWVQDEFPDLPFALTAEWSAADGQGVSFRLTDPESSRTTVFRPDELDSRSTFRRRLNGLFQDVNGDTIRVLSKRLTLLPVGGGE